MEKDKDTRSLGIMYCNEYAGKASEFLFLAFNFHWIAHEIALPGAENEIKWQVLLSTETDKEEKIQEGKMCIRDRLSEAQRLDGLDEFEVSKRYMHHYNFPSYSVGETKPSRGPGRREIGHGALAERALVPVIPGVEEFPLSLIHIYSGNSFYFRRVY